MCSKHIGFWILLDYLKLFYYKGCVLHLDAIYLSRKRKLHVDSSRTTPVIKYTAIPDFPDNF